MIRSHPTALFGAAALCLAPFAAHAHEAQNAPAATAAKAGAEPALIAEADLPADPRFSADRMKADVAFLADDLLEGRDTGSVGHEIAARFVAERFASLGLKPLGDKGGWLQRITFQQTERVDAPSGVRLTSAKGSETLAFGVDALVGVNANEPMLDVSAPLVFVGYGLQSARFGLDDYAGLDVKGKVVVMLRGYPDGLPSEEAAHLSSAKYLAAQDQGAIGTIEVDTRASQALRPWQSRLARGILPSVIWVGPDGKAFNETPGIRASAALGEKGATALFAGTSRSLAQVLKDAARKGSRPKGFDLGKTVRIFGQSKSSRITSPNVVAMIPGTDPKLAGDYVILSGHLDHIGVTPAKPGDAPDKDRINNGALDNAAGVAILLEVARILSEDKAGPRRSVIFLASTAEEKGLFGADYYARHPTVPGARLVGNVDLDQPLLTYAFTDLVAYGADHSTLGSLVTDAVKPMKVIVSPDPFPEETSFVRSDHYMFVKQGVPAVFLSTGFANGGAAAWTDYNDKHYHAPSDDMSLPINWRAGARFAEANYRITRAMADDDAPPLWIKGDFFGDLFAPKAVKAVSKR